MTAPAPWTKGTNNRADMSQRVQQRPHPAICARAVPQVCRVFVAAQAGGDLALRPRLKALIPFRHLNFAESAPVRGPFAAVFSRNVMIYMAEATQQRVWAALAAVVRPGDHLFIGHSERIGPALRDRFELAVQTTFRRI